MEQEFWILSWMFALLQRIVLDFYHFLIHLHIQYRIT